MDETIDNLEVIKNKLRSYRIENIRFNEPHFTYRLRDRGRGRAEVISNLLNPERLIHCSQEMGKYGDTITTLCFAIDETKRILLPVIFDNNKRKELYILTFILRYRPWPK